MQLSMHIILYFTLIMIYYLILSKYLYFQLNELNRKSLVEQEVSFQSQLKTHQWQRNHPGIKPQECFSSLKICIKTLMTIRYKKCHQERERRITSPNKIKIPKYQDTTGLEMEVHGI